MLTNVGELRQLAELADAKINQPLPQPSSLFSLVVNSDPHEFEKRAQAHKEFCECLFGALWTYASTGHSLFDGEFRAKLHGESLRRELIDGRITISQVVEEIVTASQKLTNRDVAKTQALLDLALDVATINTAFITGMQVFSNASTEFAWVPVKGSEHNACALVVTDRHASKYIVEIPSETGVARFEIDVSNRRPSLLSDVHSVVLCRNGCVLLNKDGGGVTGRGEPFAPPQHSYSVHGSYYLQYEDEVKVTDGFVIANNSMGKIYKLGAKLFVLDGSREGTFLTEEITEHALVSRSAAGISPVTRNGDIATFGHLVEVTRSVAGASPERGYYDIERDRFLPEEDVIVCQGAEDVLAMWDEPICYVKGPEGGEFFCDGKRLDWQLPAGSEVPDFLVGKSYNFDTAGAFPIAVNRETGEVWDMERNCRVTTLDLAQNPNRLESFIDFYRNPITGNYFQLTRRENSSGYSFLDVSSQQVVGDDIKHFYGYPAYPTTDDYMAQGSGRGVRVWLDKMNGLSVPFGSGLPLDQIGIASVSHSHQMAIFRVRDKFFVVDLQGSEPKIHFVSSCKPQFMGDHLLLFIKDPDSRILIDMRDLARPAPHAETQTTPAQTNAPTTRFKFTNS